jgi:SpoVK/Ycf46/Vps4 family AAA+-type ATPase
MNVRRQCHSIWFLSIMISRNVFVDSSSIGGGKGPSGFHRSGSHIHSEARGLGDKLMNPSANANANFNETTIHQNEVAAAEELFERRSIHQSSNNYIQDQSSVLAILGQHLLSKGFVEFALTGIQLGLCYYVTKAIWRAIVEAVDEFDTENSASGLNPDEHDSLLFSEEGVNLAADSLAQRMENQTIKDDNDDATTHSSAEQNPDGKDRNVPPSSSSSLDAGASKVSRKIGRQSAFASTLAYRLLSSGLPLDNEGSSTGKNVRSVLKSLTRTEGRLLENTLLSPSDVEHVDQFSDDRQTRLIQMWNDIGGLEDVKEGLMDLVFPLMNTFRRDNEAGDGLEDSPTYYGGLLSNPPGVLLYGPPGCGKTMMVRALAGTANARFLCVTPSTLFRKYVGETNINVKALFTLARKISPCIIFIDEMEGLFRERRSSGGEEHEVSRELKTEFMQLWDGIKAANDGIVVIGATNRPFDVDSAFLRRMPRSFFVGLPDKIARTKILSTMLSTVPLDKNFNMDHIAGNMDGYTPSDMKEVLRTAALFPLREARNDVIRRKEKGYDILMPKLRPLRTIDVVQALQKVTPTPLPHEYRSSLMSFASKATGRVFPPSPNYGSVDQGANERDNMNNNGYYVADADLNPASPPADGFHVYDGSDFDDDESYSYDEESDS